MRKCIFFLFSLLCCICVTAQTRYKVVTDSHLNVISGAYAGAPVIDSLENGSEVEVYECAHGWAKIKHNDDYAYVMESHLREVDSQFEDTPQEKGHKSFMGNVNVNVKWMVYLIAVLSLVLFGIRMVSKGKALTNSMYLVNVIVFFATMISEITYIVLSQSMEDVIWFCIPDDVGWLWTIINFVIFLFLMYNQVLCIFSIINDIQSKSNCKFGIRLGLYSIIGGIIAIGLSFSFFRNLTLYLVIAVAICQLIQIIIMVRAILPNGGWRNALLCLFVYLFGMVATAALFSYLLILLLAVLVGYVVLRLISASSNKQASASVSCSNCTHLVGQRCTLSNADAFIDDPNGTVCNQHS
jgi:hypothetical protein